MGNLTENQKRRIALLRMQNYGYKSIADAIRAPLSTVKTYCRRAGLQTKSLALKQEQALQEKPEPVQEVRNDRRIPAREPPVCEVTVSFAESSDFKLSEITSALIGRSDRRVST